nr:immunoglobulin heavy chain junction region [Mus musculus]
CARGPNWDEEVFAYW